MVCARRALLQCSLALALVVVSAGGAGCGNGDPPAATWSRAAGPYQGMLFSVWGTGADDAWAVGGCDGCASGKPLAIILRRIGGAWTQVTSPVEVALWWVSGFGSSDVWICGEKGTVLHWDGSQLSQVMTGAAADVKLFGIWGATPGDVWTVGGAPDLSSTVLRWNGSVFQPVADAPLVADGKFGGSWYKVWGSAADDVWLVGQKGTVAHYDGKAWQKVDVSGAGVTTRDGLFTAAGHGRSDVYVVGGSPGQGLAIHFDGSMWKPVSGLPLDGVQTLTGVSETAAGDVAITGFNSAKFIGREGTWKDYSKQGPIADLHAAWILGPDEAFAAGGDFAQEHNGVIVHFGR